MASIVAGWTEHTEENEHVGEVKGYVSSLPDVWEFVRQQNENKVLQREAWLKFTAHSAAPPTIVWEHLTEPAKRAAWMDAHGNEIVGAAGGRIGPGSEYHCAHGENHDIQVLTVFDRRPVNHITFMIPMGEGVALRYTDCVMPSGTGTRIVTYAAAPSSTDTGDPLPPEVASEMAGPVGDSYQAQLQQLAELSTQAAKALPSA